MGKSIKPSGCFKKDSIFIQLITSYTMLYLLLFVGIVFIYFLSPEGDPLNKGEDGKGSWNLWTGLLIWILMIVLFFFKYRYSKGDTENDPELKKIEEEIQDLADSQLPYLLKVKRERPEDWAWMVKAGLVPEDLKGDDESSNDEKLNPKDKSTSDPKNIS